MNALSPREEIAPALPSYTPAPAPSSVDPVELRIAAVRARDAAVARGFVAAARAVGRLIGRVVLFLAAYPKRRAAFDSLWRLSDRELADIGLTRSDLPSVLAGETLRRFDDRGVRPLATVPAARPAPATAPIAANQNRPAPARAA